MILLDENDTLTLFVWFLNLRCLSSQSLLSNSVLPNYWLHQNENTFYTSKKKSLIDKITRFSKVVPHSSIYSSTINHRNPLSNHSTFSENKYLLSIPRVGVPSYTINSFILNPISSSNPTKN